MLKHWTTYLKPGGRLIADVPATTSMLTLKTFDEIAPEFGIQMLGGRRWIQGPESLKEIMDEAGLETEITEKGIWDGIPARTDMLGSKGKAVWTVEEGVLAFDKEVEKGNGFLKLGEEERRRARSRFVQEWGKMVGSDGLMREEGRFYVGVGRNSGFSFVSYSSGYSSSTSRTPRLIHRIVPVLGSIMHPKCVHSLLTGYAFTQPFSVSSLISTFALSPCIPPSPSNLPLRFSRLRLRSCFLLAPSHFLITHARLSSLSSIKASIPKTVLFSFWLCEL